MAQSSSEERSYDPLLEDFKTRGYRFIDRLDPLQANEHRYTIDELTRGWGHYSPLGNKLIAEYIGERLKSWHLESPEDVRNAVEREREERGQSSNH